MPNPGLTDSSLRDSINVNIQVSDTDVSCTNPVPTSTVTPYPISQTPTISTGIYASGDAIGGKLTFANAAASAGAGGRIVKVVIVDNDGEEAAIDLVLFDQDFTATADQAAFDPSDADLANCLGYIDILAADYASFVSNSVAARTDNSRLPFPFKLSTGTSLYGQMVVRGTPTYTADDDLTIKIEIERC